MRRLLAAGSALGLFAHNAFETRAGVGLVFEPFIGRRGAYAPWSLHRGLPMLDEAEGLSEAQLPAYNTVLWFWLVCSALSLPATNRPGTRRFAIAGLLNFPILLTSAQHHFRWAREQAELDPERWSPALRE